MNYKGICFNKVARDSKGITLVALVITIIVLLILAGVVINLVLGENGILQIGKKATEKHKIESIREKVELGMVDYKAKALLVDEEVTIESVLQELVEKEVFDSIDKPEEIGVVGEYDVKLKYNENHEVVIEYIKKATGVRITYKLQPAGYTNEPKVNIIFKVTGKVKSVTNPNSSVAYPQNNVVEVEYEVTANGSYLFKVENEEGVVTDKEVIVDTIDTEAPVRCDITVTTTSTGFTIQATAEDAEATETSVKSGIDYFEYYVNGEKQKSNEITGLSQGSYTVYVIAYDKAGNPKQSEEQTIKMSRKIAKIAAGGFHSLAIDEEGNLWAWGANDKGQLGDGTTSRRLTPVPIMEGTKFKEIVATNHSLAIDEEGNLWAWGYNSDGQLGNGGSGNITVSKAPCQTEPVQIKSGTKFKKIAASNWHSLAIDEDGNLWVWGMNHIGQLGAGGTTDKTTPVQVMVGTKFKGIAAAAYDSLAIDEEGNLWGCGVNTEGELGDGTTTSRKSYIKIKSGTKFKEATMGEIRTSFTIDEGGNLWASGDNNYGTLGDGTTTDRKSPIQIKSGTFFKKVSAFDRHTLAIDEEGNLWVWGNIATNGLGDGTTTSRKSPVQIKSGTKFKEIAAGGVHSLAIDETGNLWAWGNGASGALGDGATSVRLTPVQIF